MRILVTGGAGYIGSHTLLQLLRERHDETPDWFVAAGRYHAPSNPERAERYARRVFARLARIRHV